MGHSSISDSYNKSLGLDDCKRTHSETLGRRFTGSLFDSSSFVCYSFVRVASRSEADRGAADGDQAALQENPGASAIHFAGKM